MKKLFTFIVAAVMVMSLTACAGGTKEAAETTAAENSTGSQLLWEGWF
jgi:uncharacterized lipoprotein YehR (DUF1307 family)